MPVSYEKTSRHYLGIQTFVTDACIQDCWMRNKLLSISVQHKVPHYASHYKVIFSIDRNAPPQGCEISTKFPIVPLTTRALEGKRARLGLVKFVSHELLMPFPILHEKPGDLVAHIKFTVIVMPSLWIFLVLDISWLLAGDLVAHIKFTVILMPSGSDRITGHAFQDLQLATHLEDAEVKGWLALGTKAKNKGGGKKKKGAKIISFQHLLFGIAPLIKLTVHQILLFLSSLNLF